ncbi:MAG TPA: hypothetical protein VF126_08495 [Acidobacteriaceae bacterium]
MTISMRARWAAAASLFLALSVAVFAQDAARVQSQATAEDVLASVVHHAGAIFAGEVYAIRVPAGIEEPAGVKGGIPSSRPDAVEVEFRVDVGIRGASIGSNYILCMPVSVWQQAPPFALHQRALVFLKPPVAAGFSGPVEGEADIPGMDVGVMPVDDTNNVDLSRLQRLVTRKTIASMASLPTPVAPARNPTVTDVTGNAGQETLISGSRDGRMPELRNETIPFLALVRDVTVLSGVESLKGSAAK